MYTPPSSETGQLITDSNKEVVSQIHFGLTGGGRLCTEVSMVYQNGGIGY